MLWVQFWFGALGDSPVATVDFAAQVQPLFESRCVRCHGPERQRAGLRLDRRGPALKGSDSGPVIVPGRGSDSLLIQLVGGLEPDRVMPPAGEGEPLTAAEVAVVHAWVDQGAEWPVDPAETDPALTHWAFQPVRRPEVPEGAWGRSPIDALIGARLALEGLTPSPEADRRTLLRRLYLVMLGLPPTPEEMAAFLAEEDGGAFERWVDRVLADPRYGERWGRHWLDVVRFAQSNGFETNRERLNAWRYRDYVIDAFNQDKPYDQFIREQLAGDVLGVDVATGFLVAGPVDIVGSPDPVLTAQQRSDELDDMVNTTGTAFLGLTLGCARCHSHKFDPVEQREYYSLTAVFAGVRHGERPAALPPVQAERLAALGREIDGLETRLAPFVVLARPLDPEAVSREASGPLRAPVNARRNVEAFAPVEARFVRFTILATHGSSEPCLDELEVYSGATNVALASRGTTVRASGTLAGYDIHRLEHLNDGKTGNSRSWISNESGRGWVELELPQVERLDRIVWGRDRKGEFGDRLALRYRIEVARDPGQWRVVAGSADRRVPSSEESATREEDEWLALYRFDDASEREAAAGRSWLEALKEARRERDALSRPAMVYAGNFSQPGPAYRLHRGDPMQRREIVAPATLSIFRPAAMDLDEPEAQRRLKLAHWIADPENPLTARVLVNRVWQHHFGVGLVDTPNDFGRAGSWPTHPGLLDWLARELVAGGWSVKALQRQILLSATWRQSSAPRDDALRVDAGSRLLWRFPPQRLEAEAIRDGILSVSGALDPARGGPGFYLHEVDRENVYHYHPKDDFGPAEFRRMVYAFKVRMEQDSIFGALDCPDGSLVVPRRSVSTTPLQALNLFNSRFVMDQAERLAERLRREAGPDPKAQVRRAWLLAFNRRPSEVETGEAVDFAGRYGLPALGRAVLNANEFLFIP